MPNSYTGIFPTLVAAFDEAGQALKAPNALIETVYTDISFQQGSLYDTVNLNFAASAGNATNVAGGTVTVSDVTATPRTVQLNQCPAWAFGLPDYDTARSMGVSQLRNLFVDEAIEKLMAYINGRIAALITAGNFSQVVAGGSNDTLTVAEAANAWRTLAAAKVPVRDTANLFFAMHPVVYASLFSDTNWSGGNNVSPRIGDVVRTTGQLQTTFGFAPIYDLDMPLATGVYTSLFYHRRAFAMAARALEIPQAGGIASMTVNVKGIPIRLTIDWNQLQRQHVCMVDCLFGVNVYRADHAVRHTST